MNFEETRESVEQLARVCQEKGWQLGVAESCTGGLISACVASQAGVSSFFKGSVISYARSVKAEILGVPESLMATHGEVSEPTARAMARGARQILKVDWAVAVTGIAGPSGGTPDKPVGLVHFAVAGPGIEEAAHRLFGSQSRKDIQRQATLFAFDLLLSAMR